MGYESIRLEHRGPISWIVLNRPNRANALTMQMMDEFSHALEQLKTAGGPVIGIRGEGKGFSAGIDLEAVDVPKDTPLNPVADRAKLRRYLSKWLDIWDHPKPVIAAVHGYCLALASQLCVFTDITIVTLDARIGETSPPISGGYIAPVWSSLVGPKRAKELAFVPGNEIDGRTAVEWGWANHAVPEAELISSVESLAAKIALTPPEVLRVKKMSINRAAEVQGFRASTEHVAEMDSRLHQHPEVIEAKRHLGEVGLKKAMAEYKVPTTQDLREAAKKS